MYRILLGALVGSMSILFLFLPLSSLTLFLLKLLVSIFMILVTFGYKDISSFKKNFFYFYILSIMLGGIIYFLDITFSYKNTGLIFFNNGLSINFIVLLIIGPIILFLYIKEQKEYKKNYTLIHTVEVKIKNKTYMAETFLMALGVLAIVILIVMVAPIVIFLKREDYKNLAIYFIAVCVFINADAFIITLIAAIVMLMVGGKALFKDR